MFESTRQFSAFFVLRQHSKTDGTCPFPTREVDQRRKAGTFDLAVCKEKKEQIKKASSILDTSYSETATIVWCVFFHLVRELQMDGEKFQQYSRLSREQFAQVLHSGAKKKCHAPLFYRTSAMRHAEKSLQCPIFYLPQRCRKLAGSVSLPQRTNGFMS
ncbi:hypothetical protein BaRGS_00039613 [Batillaria attramentaria]|uniref:Uncharacterized protein n=1 Tax=Batillaria attramentaria TaxID=370345 RepID=A0ABD0J2P7_9CAEN